MIDGDAIRALKVLDAIVGYVDRNGELDPGYKHEALALIETALAASEAAALREAHEALDGVRSTVEFYLRREIESPSNHQEFAREASEKLARFQTVCNTLAPTPAQAAALEKVIQSAKREEAKWWMEWYGDPEEIARSEEAQEHIAALDPEVPR